MEYTNILLYIQIRNGQPFQNPISYENFVAAFPNIDPNNLPLDQFAKFVRVGRPKITGYEVITDDSPTYEWDGDVVKDVWHTRPMTADERAEKIKRVRDAWEARPQAENWAAWTFDEETCTYVPPIPRPDPVKGKSIFWCGAENDWKEAPLRPTDGKQYNFNFTTWNWVEATSDK